MLNLIKLEIKKFKLQEYIVRVLIADLIITAIVMLIGFASKADGNPAFKEFNEAFSMIDTLVRIVFIIFASIILSKLVIDEFKNKTINLMFTCPINRKKILVSKLIIVGIFTFVCVIIGNCIVNFAIIVADKYGDIVQGDLNSSLLIENSIKVLINAVAASGISLIPLFFGMRKKSTSSTIISSVIIVTLVCSNNGGFSITNILPISLSIGLIGVLIGYLSIKNIENVDVC